MRGRKSTPTALKVIRGNPGRRPLNKAEPKLKAEIPECPEHLSAEAKTEWNRICPELKDAGILAKIDRAAIASYCQAWGRWVDAETSLRNTGTVIKAPSGYPILNPYYSIAERAMDQMRRILVEFGMTPSSRSRIKVSESQEDEADEFLTRNFKKPQRKA